MKLQKLLFISIFVLSSCGAVVSPVSSLVVSDAVSSVSPEQPSLLSDSEGISYESEESSSEPVSETVISSEETVSSSEDEPVYTEFLNNSLGKYYFSQTPEEGLRYPEYDVYLPDNKKGASYPLVITLHGGNWTGDRTFFKYENETNKPFFKKMTEAGFAVVNMEYRVLEGGIDCNIMRASSYTDMIDDIDYTLTDIKNRYGDYIDTSRACMWGYSSGGHLALIHEFTVKNPSIPVELIIAEAAPLYFTNISSYIKEGMMWTSESLTETLNNLTGSDVKPEDALFDQGSWSCICPCACAEPLDPGTFPYMYLAYSQEDKLCAYEGKDKFLPLLQEDRYTFDDVTEISPNHTDFNFLPSEHYTDILNKYKNHQL